MDWKLELVVVPVSDVDRAKAFYIDMAGSTFSLTTRRGTMFVSCKSVQAAPLVPSPG